MRDTIVRVLIETDGENCGKGCPYLQEIDAYTMILYRCRLFNVSLLNTCRADICIKSEELPRKAYKDSFAIEEKNQ